MTKRSSITILGIIFIASSLIPVFAVNILQNPSFETWTSPRIPANWTVEDLTDTICRVYKESTRVFHGNYAAKLQRMIPGTGSNKGLKQQVVIPGRGRYIARCRFYDNTDSVSGGMVITWRNANEGFISSWSTAYTVNSSSWQVVERSSASDTAPTGAALADFLIRTYGTSTTPAGGTFVVDSVFFDHYPTSIEEQASSTKTQISLEVKPNPFRNSALINFTMNPINFDAITVYDAAGNIVKTLTALNYINGSYTATWNGYNEKGILSAPGVYFVVLETKNAETKTIKTLFLR